MLHPVMPEVEEGQDEQQGQGTARGNGEDREAELSHNAPEEGGRGVPVVDSVGKDLACRRGQEENMMKKLV